MVKVNVEERWHITGRGLVIKTKCPSDFVGCIGKDLLGCLISDGKNTFVIKGIECYPSQLKRGYYLGESMGFLVKEIDNG